MDDQSTCLNDLMPCPDDGTVDLIDLISKPLGHIKREPLVEPVPETKVTLQSLLEMRDLSDYLSRGGLQHVYTLFKEIISSQDPHNDLH